MYCKWEPAENGFQCPNCKTVVSMIGLRRCIPRQVGNPGNIKHTRIAAPLPPPNAGKGGPGTELSKIIKRFAGEDASQGCDSCRDWILRMDREGPEWCRAHINEVVDRLKSQAQKRNWWKFAAMVPGADFVLREMVLTAIKRSEQCASSS